MKPVKHAGADVVYLGPTPEIGDLWCMREQPGLIRVVYELDDDDRRAIAAGGRVMLGIWTEPIPPISMQVIDEGMCRPIAEHPWKQPLVADEAPPSESEAPAEEPGNGGVQ